MNAKFLRKRTLAAAIGLILLVGLIIFLLIYRGGASGRLEPSARKIIDAAGQLRSYTTRVETDASVGGRNLHIEGIYGVDGPKNSFAAVSTTTLSLPDSNEKHVFTFRNISIGDDVYTRVLTDSPLLKITMPFGTEWHHFNKDAIPRSFSNVAVSGAVLDNLLLFSEHLRYVTFVEKKYVDVIDDHPLPRYTFKLSRDRPHSDGTLASLLDRIGSDGIVDVWVDAPDHALKYLRFHNATYTSTTTVTDVGEPGIAPPEL